MNEDEMDGARSIHGVMRNLFRILVGMEKIVCSRTQAKEFIVFFF
jgi:hypothetical protein